MIYITSIKYYEKENINLSDKGLVLTLVYLYYQ